MLPSRSSSGPQAAISVSLAPEDPMRGPALFAAVIAVMFAAFAAPTPAFADPDGTQSQSVIPFQGSLFLTLKDFAPKAPLQVYFQYPGGDFYQAPSVTGYTASDSGSATIYLQPAQFMRLQYVGPVFIVVCDDTGHCLRFVVTISTGHPGYISSSTNLAYWCDLLGY